MKEEIETEGIGTGDETTLTKTGETTTETSHPLDGKSSTQTVLLTCTATAPSLTDITTGIADEVTDRHQQIRTNKKNVRTIYQLNNKLSKQITTAAERLGCHCSV